MTQSHADQHDQDKLSRWCRDLTPSPLASFPAYAVFLVSPEDLFAHDIFREFRTSFQARGAGFEHLMIFGQHGISTTVRGILSALNLLDDNLPVLVLFREPSDDEVYSHGLLSGCDESWRTILARLEGAVDAQRPTLDLSSISGVTSRSLQDGPIRDLAVRVLEQVSENT